MAQELQSEPRVKLSHYMDPKKPSPHMFVIDYSDGEFEIAVPSRFLNHFDPREAIPKALETIAEALLNHARGWRGGK
jgi:hypothetical protein